MSSAPTAQPTAPRTRSLLPQEHGAWGQLAMPIISGLAVGSPSWSALLLTASTVLGFLAHEPWLVTLGHRGLKAVREEGPRARRVMLQLLAAAAATGAAGVWLAPVAARVALVVPILILGLFVFRMPYDEVAGIVAGACGNPAILAYSNKLAPSDRPDLGYAMIFPGMTIVKILFVDIVPALFGP